MTTATVPPPVSTRQESRRRSPASRRLGYGIAIALNVVFIYLINEWPGWASVPFLTEDTSDVVPVINAGLVVSIVANAIYLIADPRWLRAIGDAVTATVSFIVTLVVLEVFPFDFSAYSFDWTLLVRVMLVVGLIGSTVAVIGNLVIFVREVGGTLDRTPNASGTRSSEHDLGDRATR